MDVRRLIGANVRKRRLAARLSQEAFAARAGLEQSYLSGLEAGKRNPTAVTIWHLALALKIKPGVLFEASSPVVKGRRQIRKPKPAV